jgi:hypothetical protein
MKSFRFSLFSITKAQAPHQETNLGRCLSLNDITFHTPTTMQWPPWSSSSDPPRREERKPVPWKDILNATDWQHYTDPRNLVPTVLLTSAILLTIHLHRRFLSRIPEATHIRPGFFRKRSLFGTVTRVGDADNFHLFHQPGGRLTGWGWLPGRKIPEKKAELKGKTVSS